MSSGKNQYVVRHGDKWGVRGEGNQRLTREFDTQREAIDFGRGIARNQESELRFRVAMRVSVKPTATATTPSLRKAEPC